MGLFSFVVGQSTSVRPSLQGKKNLHTDNTGHITGSGWRKDGNWQVTDSSGLLTDGSLQWPDVGGHRESAADVH